MKTAKPRGAAKKPSKARVALVAPEPEAQQKMIASLQALPSALTEALLRLPRADEYDALTAPLREFTRVSPALVEALSALPRLSSLLAMAAERVDRASDRLDKRERTAPLARAHEALGRLADAAADLDDVRRSLLAAIGSIPREEDYKATAHQLRELASVSPSLLEWLKEVPKLAAPLAESIASLREAAERVASARAAVLAVLLVLAPPEREPATPSSPGR